MRVSCCLKKRQPQPELIRGGLSFDAAKLSRVDDGAGSGDGLEAHFISRDLCDHERVVIVKALGRKFTARSDAVLSQLGAAAQDEVLNSVLRFDAFVEMLVTGEYNVDPAFDQQRLKKFP